ncbi:MAG TPA: hypothetical protein VII12_12685 [Thermoanaerobaculia bacterium]
MIAALVIFSTFLGGMGIEFSGQVAIDSVGNIIVIGSTDSADFTPSFGASPRVVDAFVMKLTADGSRVLWARFLGGGRLEDTLAIAVDSSDDIYIAGRTDSPDFPVTANAPQKQFGGGTFDGYVVKLSAEGEILFATYYGGSGADAPDGIAVDREGNFVIGGDTSSVDYPLVHPFQSTNRGGTDLFVTRFASDGTVVYSTYIGSTASDAGHAITVDAAGNAWFTGAARTGDFPLINAVQPQYGGNFGDAVIVELAPDGVVLTSTYLGGSGFDGGDAITVAPDGSIWVAGRSESADFPLVNPIQGLAGKFDTFVAKLDPTGRTILFSTFIGGTQSDFPLDLVVASGGQAIVCGETASPDFPTRRAFQATYAGNLEDAFVTMLKADGSGLVFSTFLGGSATENCASMARSRDNLVAITGSTSSPNFPLVSPIRSTLGGQDDYVAKLDFTADLQLSATTPTIARVRLLEPWSFRIENRGPNDATDVAVTLLFSQPVEIRNLTAPCVIASLTEVRCMFPSLERGRSTVIAASIAPTEPGTVSVNGQVVAAEPLRGVPAISIAVEVPATRVRAVRFR